MSSKVDNAPLNTFIKVKSRVCGNLHWALTGCRWRNKLQGSGKKETFSQTLTMFCLPVLTEGLMQMTAFKMRYNSQ